MVRGARVGEGSGDRLRSPAGPGYLIFWNFSDPIVEVNAVVRYFRQPWVLIRTIW